MFQNIGKKIGRFYFTVGGIGDILLCLAGFYRKSIEPTSIVVWANDRMIAKEVLSKKLFPQLRHVIVSDNFVGHPSAIMHYENIIGDPNFQGKFHIPDDLRYVDEWSTVIDVFDHYKINRNTFVLQETFKDCTLNGRYVVLHPYSIGRDGTLKGKIIEKENLVRVLNDVRNSFESENLVVSQNFDLVCIGSHQEQQLFKDFLLNNSHLFAQDRVYYPQTITESMNLVANAFRVYSADSWTKTMGGLCGIPTTAFTCSADMTKLFPHLGYDPSDNIFMNGWGFEIVKQVGSKS
jgi:hypothetical protein